MSKQIQIKKEYTNDTKPSMSSHIQIKKEDTEPTVEQSCRPPLRKQLKVISNKQLKAIMAARTAEDEQPKPRLMIRLICKPPPKIKLICKRRSIKREDTPSATEVKRPRIILKFSRRSGVWRFTG